jgi:hypothetical protein
MWHHNMRCHSYLWIRLVPFWQFLVILDDLSITHVTSGKFCAVLKRIVHSQVQEVSLHTNTRTMSIWQSHSQANMLLDPTQINPAQTLTAHSYKIHPNTTLPCILGSPKQHPSNFSTKILRTPLNFSVSATYSTDFVHLHDVILITHSEYYALIHSANVVSSFSSPNIMFSSAPYSQHPQIGFFSSL